MTVQTISLSVPLFRTLTDTEPRFEISFNGQPLSLPADCSLAAALLAVGVSRFRSAPVSGTPRGPFCMMGACFECLVEIDGVPNRQSCMVPVRAGMKVHSTEGSREQKIILNTAVDTMEGDVATNSAANSTSEFKSEAVDVVMIGPGPAGKLADV